MMAIVEPNIVVSPTRIPVLLQIVIEQWPIGGLGDYVIAVSDANQYPEYRITIWGKTIEEATARQDKVRVLWTDKRAREYAAKFDGRAIKGITTSWVIDANKP
jgi:hypothetical protein